MKRKLAVLVVYAAASLGLAHAQSSDKAKGPAAEDPKPPCPPTIDNVTDGTKNALACGWLKPNAVPHFLNALQYLTIPTRDKDGKLFLDQAEAVKLALKELIDGDPGNEDLYRAAIGLSDSHGQYGAQGISSLLDALAKAKTDAPANADTDPLAKAKTPPKEKLSEHDFFTKRVQPLIDGIFGKGKIALTEINGRFAQKDNYVAIYLLLTAYTKYNETAAKDIQDKYANNLEILRAAFALDTAELAKKIALKIAPAKP